MREQRDSFYNFSLKTIELETKAPVLEKDFPKAYTILLIL